MLVHTCAQGRPYSNTHTWPVLHVSMTSQRWNIHEDGDFFFLIFPSITAEFPCWQPRCRHGAQRAFFTKPTHFQSPPRRRAARCPRGSDDRPANICACTNQRERACTYGWPLPSAIWSWPPRWVQTVCVGGRVSLWNVLNQQGAQQSTAVCVCVCNREC